MTFSSNLSNEIKQRIESVIPGAEVVVNLASERHYEISVVSAAFEDLSQVKQHQRVYAAITELMAGNDAPVHAIDRMNTSAH
ncbi:MAG: BolA/IbaG family iron-sulfur metabolism protein [Methylococcales bacterium]